MRTRSSLTTAVSAAVPSVLENLESRRLLAGLDWQEAVYPSTSPFNSAIDSATAVDVAPDGKTVVAVSASEGGGSPSVPYLVRYNTDGTLDTTFDSDGISALNLFTLNGEVVDVDVLDDGSILVAGTDRSTANSEMFIGRVNNDGSLSASFGTLGSVRTPYGSIGLRAEARAVVATTDGGFIAGGLATNGPVTEATYVKYDATGALDPTFGSGGVVYYGFPGQPDTVVDLIANDDNTVTALIGTTTAGLTPTVDPTIQTLTAAGTDGGTAQFDLNFGQLAGFEVDADGNYLIAGTGYSGTSINADVYNAVRVTPSLVIDTTYGVGGAASQPFFAGGVAFAFVTTLTPDGGVAIVGSAAPSPAGPYSAVAVAFDNAGTPDLTFGDTASPGVYQYPGVAFGEFELFAGAAATDDGFIAVGNDATGAAGDSLIVRFTDTTLPQPPANPLSYDDNGRLIISGTAGNDTIEVTGSGSTLTVTINGTVYANVLSSKQRFFIEAGAGDDYVTLINLTPGDFKPSVDGGAGDDTLIGSDGNDTIVGGTGNDDILGFGGNDLLRGQAGNDFILGGDGDDEILGNAGNDTLIGEAGDDSINGGAGADNIQGEEGNDTLLGGGGNDIIDGGAGFSDRLYGDAGDDLLIDADGVLSAYGDVGDDVLDLTFAANWRLASFLPVRASVGLLRAGLGDDVVRIHVDGPSALYLSVNLDEFQKQNTPDGDDTIILTGNYASNSVVFFDSPLGSRGNNYAAGNDRAFFSRGRVLTLGDNPTMFSSEAEADAFADARIDELS